MITNNNTETISLLKLIEDVDELISSENKKSEENRTSLKNLLDEEELNNNIPADIDKKILEMVEKRDFDLANSKKNKSKKKGLDLLNEQLENLIKKTMNESKTDSKGTDSLSKKSREGKKKIIKHIKNYNEDNDNSQENNNNSITLIMNSDNSNYINNINNDSSSYGDENELMEFLNKKTCSKKNLKKYKEKYEKMKKNINKIIIFDSEDDSEEIK